jgi:hypothetical protein
MANHAHGRIKFSYDCHTQFDADVKQSDIGFDSSIIGSLSALLVSTTKWGRREDKLVHVVREIGR